MTLDVTRFSGQTAIVTGGADGIGKAVAYRLASEGAAVTLFDLNQQRLASALAQFEVDGLAITGLQVDIGEEHAVRDSIAAVVKRSARLDILVHCAGIVGPNGMKAAEVSVEDFDMVYRVNLRGSFLVVKYAVPHMLARDYGRILLFASIAGKEGNAGMTCYSATKAGVIGLVKAAGKEYAETGITINAIAPAVIRTPMVDGMEPRQVKYMTDKIPLKRCGTLAEAASLSAWIVSPEAAFNTAVTFDLSGGRATY
jgi:NAD(P)-dependent dehydrogenase (short-subunit alcohol dehydrogenase family)